MSYLVVVKIDDRVIVSILVTVGEHARPVTETRLDVELRVHSTSGGTLWGTLLAEDTGVSPVADSDLTETGEVSW